jgi:Concanavalin A-like lectin/glucanases superfamily
MFKIFFLSSVAQHPQRTFHRPLRTVKFFLCACLFLLATGLITRHVAAQLQNGLAGYWSFDEGRGTTAGDSSGNGNTGTLMNGPTWVSGKSGTALSFDGADDYVEIPEAQSLNLSSALTVSAWINNQASTDSSLSQDQYRIIASKGWAPNNSGSWSLAWRVNDGSLFFFAGRATSYRYVSSPYDNSQAGTWHLVTAVLDNGTLSLYQDGVLQAGPVSIDSSKLRTDTSPILIGSSPTSNNWLRNWNGSIDEFRLYNRALSADEIASLYQQDNQSFNFSLANSMDLSAAQGASATNTITANLVTGSPEAVSFSATGVPSGASASFSQKTCSPTCSSLLTIATAASTPTGTYTITVAGTGGGVTRTTSFTLTVNSPTGSPPSPPSSNTISTNIADGAVLSGSSVVWTATPSGSPLRVEFFIDAALLWTENVSPYQFNGDPSGTLNTNTLSNSSHQLKVRATYSDNSTAEQTVTVTISNGATPTSVAAPAQLTLTWQDNSDNEDNFTIEQKTGTNGTYSQIAFVAANVTSYVDSSVTSGVNYCYRVRAVNTTGASAYTNEACATVP